MKSLPLLYGLMVQRGIHVHKGMFECFTSMFILIFVACTDFDFEGTFMKFEWIVYVQFPTCLRVFYLL